MKITKKQYLYFIDVANEILYHPEYQKLKRYEHHFSLSRYEHCFDVALYAYCYAIRKKKNVNLKMLIRAGLLHDFFLYDRRKEIIKRHLRMHPIAAYHNSEEYFKLHTIEKNIILSHMWPVGGKFPKFKESRIVNRADKRCAIIETFKLQKKLREGIMHTYNNLV